jgi:hypothetical protein
LKSSYEIIKLNFKNAKVEINLLYLWLNTT